MSVFSAIQERRSIRKYKSTPIEKVKLEKVLESVRLSPSAGNAQNWKFIVVNDPEKIQKLKDAAGGQEFVGQAPIVIVGIGTLPDQIMTCGQHRYTVDLSIAFSHLILQAHELGLGTCWLGRFDEDKVKQILNIPAKERVVAVTPVGYPDETPSARPRKNIEEIVSYNTYK